MENNFNRSGFCTTFQSPYLRQQKSGSAIYMMCASSASSNVKIGNPNLLTVTKSTVGATFNTMSGIKHFSTNYHSFDGHNENSGNAYQVINKQPMQQRRNFFTTDTIDSLKEEARYNNPPDSRIANIKSVLLPIINSFKDFFTNKIRPFSSPEKSLANLQDDMSPNIYMNLTSTKNSNDIDLPDLTNYTATNDLKINGNLSTNIPEIKQFSMKEPINTLNSSLADQNKKTETNTSDGNGKENLSQTSKIIRNRKRYRKQKKYHHPTIGNKTVDTVPTIAVQKIKPNFHPANMCHPTKRSMNKNRKEKNRHEIIWNICEDIHASDDNTDEIDSLSQSSPKEISTYQLPYFSVQKTGIPKLEEFTSRSTSSTSLPVNFTMDDFPAIGNTTIQPISSQHSSVKPRKCIRMDIPNSPKKSLSASASASRSFLKNFKCKKSQKKPVLSQLPPPPPFYDDSDDNFIIFCSESPNNSAKIPPGFMEPNSSSICDRLLRVKPFLPPPPRRRQLSECSDESFVICFENDEDSDDDDDDDDENDGKGSIANELDTDTSDNSDSDEENVIEPVTESETDDSDSEDEVDANQPDSGFEERKVRFNLKPEVHVIRAWNFAYRQARKGQWEEIGRDRVRFYDRIQRLDNIISPILDESHRGQIYKERFDAKDDNNTVNSCSCCDGQKYKEKIINGKIN